MDMMSVLGVISFLALVFISAFYQLSPLRWTLLIGAALLLSARFSLLPHLFFLVSFVLYVAAICFVHLHELRRHLIIMPALPWLKKQIPNISETEQVAIDAGDIWWEKALFSGAPDWQTLLSMPKPTLTEDETRFLNEQVETLCAKLNDWQMVEEAHDLPEDVWAYLKHEKFFGMVIPKQYGGLGFSALAHSSVVLKIATRSLSAAVNMMVPNSLGPAELLLHYGTDEQKSYYLPRLATGVEMPCFALTAPTAGSDAGAIPDSGVITQKIIDGKKVLGMTLNWDKRYITLAPVATLLGLAFHLYDPDHLLGDKTDIGITLCLIATNQPGVEIGNRHYPLRLAFMNGPTRGKDVFVPLDAIIGGVEMAGQGWRMLMECLSVGRSISLPALATACGKLTYRYTGAYAKVRRQFNTSLSSFEGIEEALGMIAGKLYLLEATRLLTAGAVDQGLKPAIASAMAKYHMTEMSREVVSHAMDVHAGHMVQVGPRNYIANLYFAMPISITVEGANILTRNLIIFGQGAIRCHPFLLKEVALLREEKINVPALDDTLLSHAGRFVSLLFRNVGYALTGGHFIFASRAHKETKSYQKQLTRMSAALALLSDASLMLLGGRLKRQERLSARLGDLLSQLYLSSAVLKYFKDQGSSESDVPYVKWCLAHTLAKMQIAIDDICQNYPHRFIGRLLSWLIFPWGKAYAFPSDQLNHDIVLPMLSASPFRDRLTEHCYVSKNHQDATSFIEKTLAQCDEAHLVLKKWQQAIHAGKISIYQPLSAQLLAAKKAKVLTEAECEIFKTYEEMYQEVIKVNEFSFDLKQVVA